MSRGYEQYFNKVYLSDMRVLEPMHTKHAKNKKPKKSISKLIPVLIVLTILVAGGLYGYKDFTQKETTDASLQQLTELDIPEDDPFDITTKPLKQLKGDGFKDLYMSVALPNTQEIIDPPSITGDDAADARIRMRAEARGYKLSRIPMGAIIKVENEPRLDGDDLLQPLAADAWSKLREASRREGYPISLLSAFRSPKYQQDLFKERLMSRGVTITQIVNGSADAEIDATLQVTAVPGYSRHHSGYTIDLWCEDGSTAFVESRCYDWISENDYKMAMEFGWIPSYPEGATDQGPEPEPWEYVWVGNAVRQL